MYQLALPFLHMPLNKENLRIMKKIAVQIFSLFGDSTALQMKDIIIYRQSLVEMMASVLAQP